MWNKMSQQIYRSNKELERKGLSWSELWEDEDKGLITCWEVGRQLRKNKPELAEKAMRGELPTLGWKGGSDKALNINKKYGSLNYLAQWQGLRGEDLNIDMSEETVLICSKTGMEITYTPDIKKFMTA